MREQINVFVNARKPPLYRRRFVHLPMDVYMASYSGLCFCNLRQLPASWIDFTIFGKLAPRDY